MHRITARTSVKRAFRQCLVVVVAMELEKTAEIQAWITSKPLIKELPTELSRLAKRSKKQWLQQQLSLPSLPF